MKIFNHNLRRFERIDQIVVLKVSHHLKHLNSPDRYHCPRSLIWGRPNSVTRRQFSKIDTIFHFGIEKCSNTNYPTSSPINQLDKRNFELISNIPLSSMSKQGAIIRVDTSDRIKVSLDSGLNKQFEFVGRPMAGVTGNEGKATH